MRNQLPSGLLCLFWAGLLLNILSCDNLDVEPSEDTKIDSNALAFFEVTTLSATKKIFLKTVQIRGKVNQGNCGDCLERVGFFYGTESQDLFDETLTFQALTEESIKASADRKITRIEVPLDSIQFINGELSYSYTFDLREVDQTYYFRSYAVFHDNSSTKELKRSHLSQEPTPIEVTLKDGWFREYHDGNLWAREEAFAINDINNEVHIGLGCALPSFCDIAIVPQPFLKFQVDDDEVVINAQPETCPLDNTNSIGNRAGPVAFRIENQIYFGTGLINNASQKDFFAYDPNNCADGTTILEMPEDFTARKDAIGFTIEKYGYIGLGLKFGFIDFNFVSEALSDFWRFDPAAPLAEQWCNLEIMDGIDYVPRSLAIVIETNDGSIIFGGGINQANKRLTDFWKLTPNPDSCTATVVPITTVPVDLVGAFGDGISFTIKGIPYAGLGAKNTNFYKLENKKWSPVASFPGSPILKGVGFSVGNRGYVFTGSFEASLPTDPPTPLPAILSTDLWIYVPE